MATVKLDFENIIIIRLKNAFFKFEQFFIKSLTHYSRMIECPDFLNALTQFENSLKIYYNLHVANMFIQVG